jgi:hypothetical protein
LPAEQSDFAQQILKDPDSFDFLSLGPEMRARHLELGKSSRLPVVNIISKSLAKITTSISLLSPAAALR